MRCIAVDYLSVVNKIKSKFSKQELKYYDLIVPFNELHLASFGSNDVEGYQIFTPEFIVKDMCKAIGEKEVFDSSKTILEPTSGDGAFTVYILLKRLEKAYKDNKDNIEVEGLKALSTIYSNEMDKDLIIKQRNNILTAYVEFAKKKKIKWSGGYLDLIKCLILKNFTWGMFNSDNPIDAGLFGTEVVYKMPQAEKGDYQTIEFPVWNITNGDIDFVMEGVDL